MAPKVFYMDARSNSAQTGLVAKMLTVCEAMGIDAYRILPHLARLESDENETLDGKTGILHLDRSGRVHRQLVWAEMKRGKPKVIGYVPRMDERTSSGAPAASYSPFGR